ncbi:hypothetical protein HMPREF3160_05380 [Arthrobacter sp. HMSC06H05]|uniref:SseB family protein n=1 Tax=Arthrobacter sp. HMSC06H05 TaxID=1581128 RepID=UPI0008A4EC14|nr:SseB family protein [Arthrobacter sp. HMSC06H05]OFT42179.1 hypothetical protein HMPREF3160_05380 [Arthrobacter sp. HMSC06H05]
MSHTHDHEHSHQNPGHQNPGENNPSQPRMSDTRSEAAIAHQEKFPRPEKDQPGGALLRSYIAYDQGPNGDTLLAFGSDFFGTKLYVPVAARSASGAVTQLVAHGFEELRVVEAAFSEEEARSLWTQIRPDDEVPEFAGLYGDELAEIAFKDTSFGASGITGIVVDPMDTGMLIRPEDETMQFPLHNGRLRAAVLAGHDDAVQALMGEGEVVLMTQKTGEGEHEGVAFMKNKETGEMILPVFSSTLEVFRHNPDAGSVMVPLTSLRTTVKPGMGMVIDPASPEAVELPSAELEEVGYYQT